MLNSIAIFCGSSLGNEACFTAVAAETGRLIAERGQTLVYGGGRSGLMGVVADSALQAGGRVVGVMPHLLVDQELAHPDLTEMHIVDNMQERKLKMSELADGFIALPGGAGTLEEIFEQWTWLQLGIHQKPCGFLNVSDFYTDLIRFLQRTAHSGFTYERFTDKLVVEQDIAVLLQAFDEYVAPVSKWQVSKAIVEEKK
jgi:uncharacterized protein (TIGR00730 family)